MMNHAFGGTDPWGLAPLAGALGLSVPLVIGVFIIVTLWTLVWKALALWHTARNRQKIWFVAFLIVNTMGILEIAYLLWFKKDNNTSGGGSLFPKSASRVSSSSSPAEGAT